ncbi:MAG: type I restriction enzyme HsdR N-terminal domain-containing protein [Cytophagales bacterium]
MKKLIFPEFDLKVKQSGENLLVFDVIRKDYVTLTPEEWVRQHVVHTLINFKKYPKSLISIEKSLKIKSLLKRTDIVIFDKNLKPFMLIECKAPEEKLNENVLKQALIYNSNKKAPYICITNGIEVRVFQIDTNGLKELLDFPEFE